MSSSIARVSNGDHRVSVSLNKIGIMYAVLFPAPPLLGIFAPSSGIELIFCLSPTHSLHYVVSPNPKSFRQNRVLRIGP
jgi:hypothetical protein